LPELIQVPDGEDFVYAVLKPIRSLLIQPAYFTNSRGKRVVRTFNVYKLVHLVNLVRKVAWERGILRC